MNPEAEAKEILEKFDGDQIKACEYVSTIILKAKETKQFWIEVKSFLPCVEVQRPKRKRIKVDRKQLTEHQKTILNAMKKFKQFTDKQISDETGMDTNNISPRRKEFKRMGLIREKERKVNIHGRAVVVWELC